jgi:hypothetical protein
MRKRYRWNPKTLQQEPINEEASQNPGLIIMGDIPDFVSPIDGRIVHGRAGLRAHNKEHDVTNAADYKETWKKAGQERANFYSGGQYDSKRRKEALIRAYDTLQRRAKK